MINLYFTPSLSLEIILILGELSSLLQILQGSSEQLADASRLEDGVPFYRIYDSDVARRFHIDPAAKRSTLVFLTKEENFTLYGMYSFISTSEFSSNFSIFFSCIY